MAGLQQSSDGAISAINVTPFVDVVLVLLIILMVTSTEIARQSIKVELPKAAAGGEGVPRTLNLILSADGVILLDGEPAKEMQIKQTIQEAKARTPKVRAVISADQAVAYRKVVRLIDLVKGAGVHRFALDVAPGEAP